MKTILPVLYAGMLFVVYSLWTASAISTEKGEYTFEDYQRDIRQILKDEHNYQKTKDKQRHPSSNSKAISEDHRQDKPQKIPDTEQLIGYNTATAKHHGKHKHVKSADNEESPMAPYSHNYNHYRHNDRRGGSFNAISPFDPNQCCPGSLCACGMEVSSYLCYAPCLPGYFGVGSMCYNISSRKQTYNRGNGYGLCNKSASGASLGATPQQIHLTFGESSSTEMVVQWASFDFPIVIGKGKVGAWVATYKFEKDELDKAIFVPAEVVYYRSDDNKKGAPYYYIVKLEGLRPNTRYYYRVGATDSSSASDIDKHKVSHHGTFRMLGGAGYNNNNNNVHGASLPINNSRNIIFTADMGVEKSEDTTTAILQELINGWPDVWFHAGDYAYDMHSHGGLQGDIFFQRNEPIMMNLPLQGAPGNHEHEREFSQYIQRYRMPNYETSRNMWYSMDIGAAHFVFFSTEVYYYPQPPSIGGEQAAKMQREWLVNDLAKANKNRKNVPWIITISHRPFYCSNEDRPPIEYARLDLEKMFYDAGVDIMVTGHKHSYERTYPIYNNIVTGHSSHNADGIIHIINGQAGCSEGTSPILHPSDFTACYHWRPWLNSYGKMRVHNGTHIYWELVCTLTGNVLDSVTVSKDKPFPNRPVKI